MPVLLSGRLQNIQDSIHQILDTFSADIDYSRGIFLKPNIVFPIRPESGEITSPVLVKILVSALRERHRDVEIIMGEGVAAGCDPLENFTVSGYVELAKELNIQLLDLDNVERKRVAWKFGNLSIPSVVFEKTYINLPILKPSSACIISGALKNQKGLLLPEVKKQFHRKGLHEQIAELNKVVQPKLTIMDGSNFFGRNVLISGNNCGEIDASACSLLGIDEPDHIALAKMTGVFADGFSVTGDEIHRSRNAIQPVAKEFKRFGRLRLWSNPRACTMCRNIFRDIQHNFIKHPDLPTGIRLLSLSIKGAELLMGTEPYWKKEYGTVICVGECTRRMAKKDGHIHIPGCPPTVREFLDGIPKLSQNGSNIDSED